MSAPTVKQSDAHLTELRTLAEAATPGPWWAMTRGGDDEDAPRDVVATSDHVVGGRIICEYAGSDAAYIAAVSPDVLLPLLDELEASRAREGASPSAPARTGTDRNA